MIFNVNKGILFMYLIVACGRECEHLFKKKLRKTNRGR